MRDFTEQLGFIVSFLVSLLFLSFLGEKVVFYFSLLVLVGMVLINSEKFKNLLGG